MYISTYHNLCEANMIRKPNWKPGSGFHRHHIIPTHAGGTDDDDNFTYLTPREHQIAHWLLWKIHGNPNDLRSMKMLGARLSTQYRRIVGKWCADNKIGVHGYSKERKAEIARGVLEKQRISGDTNSYYWWSTKEGQRKRASMGGSIGGARTKELGVGIHNTENQKLWASMGGKAMLGSVVMHHPDLLPKWTRVFPQHVNIRLSEGWAFGKYPQKPPHVYTRGPYKTKPKISS